MLIEVWLDEIHELLHVDIVVWVKRNAGILFDYLDCQGHGPSIDGNPFINNSVLTIFVTRCYDLPNPVGIYQS